MPLEEKKEELTRPRDDLRTFWSSQIVLQIPQFNLTLAP